MASVVQVHTTLAIIFFKITYWLFIKLTISPISDIVQYHSILGLHKLSPFCTPVCTLAVTQLI